MALPPQIDTKGYDIVFWMDVDDVIWAMPTSLSGRQRFTDEGVPPSVETMELLGDLMEVLDDLVNRGLTVGIIENKKINPILKNRLQ